MEKIDSIEYILKVDGGAYLLPDITGTSEFPWIPVLFHELNVKDPKGLPAICHVLQTEMHLHLGVSRSINSLGTQAMQHLVSRMQLTTMKFSQVLQFIILSFINMKVNDLFYH